MSEIRKVRALLLRLCAWIAHRPPSHDIDAELGVTLVVRSSSDPAALVEAVRARVREVNPQIAVFNAKTMEEVVSDSLWQLDLYRRLVGSFAALALLLSAVGLYGVISCVVSSRHREWAVRLALGSAPGEIMRLVPRRGVRLAAAGTAIGGVLTFLVVQLLGGSFGHAWMRLPLCFGMSSFGR